MPDLDIGMNDRLCEPLTWDDSRELDRGKVMTAEDLEAGQGLRPLPRRRRRRHPVPHLSRHAPDQGLASSPAAPTKRPLRALLARKAPVYVDNMERLLRKFETAKTLVPQPLRNARPSRPASA